MLATTIATAGQQLFSLDTSRSLSERVAHLLRHMAMLGLQPGAPRHLAYGTKLRRDLLLLELDDALFEEVQDLTCVSAKQTVMRASADKSLLAENSHQVVAPLSSSCTDRR